MQQLKILLDRIRPIHGKKQIMLRNPQESTTQENPRAMAMQSVAVFSLIQSSDGILVSRSSVFNSFPLLQGFRAALDFCRT